MSAMKDKVALITGGSSGLGEATALRFAREGAKVVIAARRLEQSRRVVERIIEKGGQAHFIRTDVSCSDDIENMIEGALGKYGRLDYAVNNAGIAGPRFTPIAEVTVAHWDKLMDVNLKGVFLCMKHEITAMLARGGGAIVNVASIYGLKPSDMGHTPYATSKFGVVGLTMSAAADYGQKSIRINAIAPGFTKTEMVDPEQPGAVERLEVLVGRHSSMKRLGKAEETANAIVWLCSDEAAFVNGAVLPVDGGSATGLF